MGILIRSRWSIYLILRVYGLNGNLKSILFTIFNLYCPSTYSTDFRCCIFSGLGPRKRFFMLPEWYRRWCLSTYIFVQMKDRCRWERMSLLFQIKPSCRPGIGQLARIEEKTGRSSTGTNQMRIAAVNRVIGRLGVTCWSWSRRWIAVIKRGGEARLDWFGGKRRHDGRQIKRQFKQRRKDSVKLLRRMFIKYAKTSIFPSFDPFIGTYTQQSNSHEQSEVWRRITASAPSARLSFFSSVILIVS